MELEEQQWWTTNMMNASGGRIKVDTFPCDVLVPAAENMTACGAGMVDLVLGSGGYWTDTIPIAALEANIPYSWQYVEESQAFHYGCGFLELLRQAYAEQNCYYIAPLLGSDYMIMSAKEFHNLEEWKEVKTRTAGLSAEVLNAVGVPTCYLPGSEIYLALSTGTIDAFAWCCPYTYYLMKYYEVAKYLIKPPLATAGGNGLLMNLDLWNSLPDDIKEIVRQSAEAAQVMGTSYWVNGNIEATSLMREEGVSVITLPAEDVKVLTEASMKLLDTLAEKDPTYAAPAVEAFKDFLRKLGRL